MAKKSSSPDSAAQDALARRLSEEIQHLDVLESITDGVLVLDPQRRIVYANRVMAGYYGREPESFLGQLCHEVVGFSHCKECPHDGVLTGSICYTAHNVRGEHAEDAPFCVSASPLTAPDGTIIGVVETYRDMRALGAYIGEIEDKNLELEVERRRLDEILTDSSDGYFAADLDRNILRADEKLLELLGKTEDEVVGSTCAEVFGSDKCDSDCPIVWAREHGQNVINCREMIRAVHGVMPVDKSVFLHRTADGEPESLIGVIRNASEIVDLRRSVRRAMQYKKLISANAKMESAFELINTFAPTDSPVLILGESGTGKELVAEAIQENSLRKTKPFLKINCSALAEGLLESELFGHTKGSFTGADRDKRGKFEVADGGTLFLDEVGDMSPALQTKILRVLEAQEFEPVGSTRTVKVNVRIVAATNRELVKMIQEGSFREDLYYRLNAIQIKLPSLEERIEDIPLLVNRFLSQLESSHSRGVNRISSRALELLQRYSWPGNIRELRNAIEFGYVCAKGDRIERRDLPEHIRDHMLSGPAPSESNASGSAKSDEITAALQRFEGNRELAARSLGISRTTLWRRMRALDIAEDRLSADS